MPKKYYNGYKPVLFNIDNGTPQTLSIWQPTVFEYYEPYWAEVMDIGGERFQAFRFVHFHWVIDMSKGAPPEDVKILNDVINGEILGKAISLAPYSDYSARKFEVFSVKETIQYRATPGGESAEGMEMIKATFTTRKPLYKWDLLDLNQADLMYAPTGEGIDFII